MTGPEGPITTQGEDHLSTRRSATGSLFRLLALLMALGLIAAACGGEEETEEGGSAFDDDAEGDDATGGGGTDTTEAAEGGTETTDTTEAAEPAAQPRQGGEIVIGQEAEVDGFNPVVNRFPVAGLTYANTVFDPLAIFNAEGETEPYLAESIEPNEDATVWTITLREGISFHDGTPLNSDALLQNLQGHRDSFLTGAALKNITELTKVDDLTVDIQMATSWWPFPGYLTGQLGFVAAPSMLNDTENGSRNPVGTGPFVFESWRPGESFVAVKNTDYWRADEGLPYLDRVEIRPILEAESRANALRTGDIDLMHTSSANTIDALQADADSGDIVLDTLTDGPTEENFLLLNTATPPFDNLNARFAVAHAIDQQRVIDDAFAGLSEPSFGPFSGEDEYAAPENYPQYDVEMAQEFAATFEEETGGPLTFTLGTTNNQESLQIASSIQELLREAGIETEIQQYEQSAYINQALFGEHQAYSWRQYGAPAPDLDFVWWAESSTSPVGEISLNFSRLVSEDVNTLMNEARATEDPEARGEFYGQVQEAFAEEMPYIYYGRTLWAYASSPEIGGVQQFPLVGDSEGEGGGNPLAGVIRPGALYFTE